MKNTGILASFLTLLILTFSASLAIGGVFEDKIDKAQKLAKLDGYEDQAHTLLQEAIMDDADDAKTLFRAGEVYLQMGWDRQADKALDNAFKLKESYGSKIGKIYRDRAVSAGSHQQTYNAFKKAVKYDVNHKIEACDYFLSLVGAPADKRPKQILDYAKPFVYNNAKRRQVGKGYLWLATEASGYNREELKNEAARFVGYKVVDEVFPGYKPEVIFENVLDDSMGDKVGDIQAMDFAKVHIKTGDTIELHAHIPDEALLKFPADEPLVEIGHDKKWLKVTNKKAYSRVVGDYVNRSGYLKVWLEKGHNIKATLRVLRNVLQKPNMQVVASL